MRFFLVFFPPKPRLCNCNKLIDAKYDCYCDFTPVSSPVSLLGCNIYLVEVEGIEPSSISLVNKNQRILIVPPERLELPMYLTLRFYRPLASPSLHMSAFGVARSLSVNVLSSVITSDTTNYG